MPATSTNDSDALRDFTAAKAVLGDRIATARTDVASMRATTAAEKVRLLLTARHLPILPPPTHTFHAVQVHF